MSRHSRYAWLCLPVLLVWGLGWTARGETTPGADEIMKKAVARAESQTQRVPPDFQYTKLTLTEELDSAGKVRERKEKVYEIVFTNGVQRARLLRVNGGPPSAEDRKKQTENEASFRQMTGHSKGARRESRDNFLTADLVSRYQFRLVGETNVSGRGAYQLAFEPKKPEPPVRRLADRFLNRISGTVWIDAEEFELAGANIVLRSEVNLLGGIAGTLRKLNYTTVRTRVADGLWLPTLSHGDFEGRMLLDSTRIRTRTEAVDFRNGSVAMAE